MVISQSVNEQLWLMTIEYGTHSGSRNVVGQFTLHAVQNPQNQKSSIELYLVCSTKWIF